MLRHLVLMGLGVSSLGVIAQRSLTQLHTVLSLQDNYLSPITQPVYVFHQFFCDLGLGCCNDEY